MQRSPGGLSGALPASGGPGAPGGNRSGGGGRDMTLFEIRKLAHVDVPSWHHFQVDAICAIHLEVHDRYVAYGYSSPGAGAYLDRLKEEWHATAGERYVQICLALSH